jgi:hypothetical protein
MFRHGVLFICIPFTIFANDPSFEKFLTTHCVSCHGPKKEKGDLRIDTLSRDFKAGMDSHLWAEVNERINAGEMPPEEEPRPSEKEISEFIAQLDQKLSEGKAARMAARPPVAHYRLSRKEYQNTVYDLLGVRYDPTKPGELNEDTLWHGYERIGSQLSLSPSHINRYYQAAEIVLERAFPQTEGEVRKVKKTAADLRYGGGEKQKEALKRFGIKRPLRQLLFPGRVDQALAHHWFGKTGTEHSGLYKLRLQASGIRPPGGQPAHLSIGVKTSEENVDGMIELDITAPEDKPQVYEFEIFLEMPIQLHFAVVSTNVIDRRGGGAFRGALASRNAYIFTHSSETALLNPNAPQMFDGEGNGIFSTVILDWIEWEGPIVTPQEKSLRKGIFPENNGTIEQVSHHLQSFAERAWRRKVNPQELSGYLRSYQKDMEAGDKIQDAFRTALLRVLTSRNFIYLVEGEPQTRERLNEHELASRLSYFLWSSMPDDSLFALANKGRLNGAELSKQVDRMLSDARPNGLSMTFPVSGYNCTKWECSRRTRNFIPPYDDWLETEYAQRTGGVFSRIAESITCPSRACLIRIGRWPTPASATSTVYPSLPKQGFQRVSLKPEHNRGGLLTMGGVLGLTSDGTRHRPVHRGVWLSETYFQQNSSPSPGQCRPDRTRSSRRRKDHHPAKNGSPYPRSQLRRLPQIN